MSSLLSAIGCALLGLAVGAALQRWGDGERETHGHKVVNHPPRITQASFDAPQTVISDGAGYWIFEERPIHRSIADQWTGW